MKKHLAFAIAIVLGLVMGRWLVINLAAHYLSKDLIEETENYLESIR